MKSGTAAFAALALAAFAVPRPAAADWEYTRWGMTAEQVIAASRGAASIVPIDSRYRNEDEEYEITVEAVTSGPPVLNIGFMFDIPGGGLNSTIAGLAATHPFSALTEFSDKFRCIAADLRSEDGEVLQMALAKHPDKRFASAEAMRRALAAVGL